MTDEERESLYNEALKLKEENNYDSKKRALKRFEELDDYKDSRELAAECRKYVEEADSFVGNVYKKRNKAKKAVKITITAIVAIGLCLFIYNRFILREINYKKAVALYAAEDYDGAREIFEKLGKYRDSQNYMKEASQQTGIAVNNTIYFGSIEQDNDGEKEYIEWIILDIVDNKALLLSKYAIYCYMYDDQEGDSLWAYSMLRTWLNNDFITKCFTREERQRICPTTVGGDRNPYYEQNFAEENSRDLAFILSASELVKYLDTAEKRKCYATSYALYYGAVTNAETGTTFYWTRTQGSTNNNVVTVDSTGEIFYAGSVKTSIRRAVRPAIWIDLEGMEIVDYDGPEFDGSESTDTNHGDYIKD